MMNGRLNLEKIRTRDITILLFVVSISPDEMFQPAEEDPMPKNRQSLDNGEKEWKELLSFGPEPDDLVFVITRNIKPFRTKAWKLLQGMSGVNQQLREVVRAGDLDNVRKAARYLLKRNPDEEDLYAITSSAVSDRSQSLGRTAWNHLKEGEASNQTLRELVGHFGPFQVDAAEVLINQNPTVKDLALIMHQIGRIVHPPSSRRVQRAQAVATMAAQTLLNRMNSPNFGMDEFITMHELLPEQRVRIAKAMLKRSPRTFSYKYFYGGNFYAYLGKTPALEKLRQLLPPDLAARFRKRFEEPTPTTKMKRETRRKELREILERHFSER